VNPDLNPDAVFTYLFTCRVVSHGPGRASQETSWSGMCPAPSSWLQMMLSRPAHLVALSCFALKVVTSCCLPDSTGYWYVIPAAHYSVDDQKSTKLQLKKLKILSIGSY
jgi:hypothetical protein